MALYKWERYSLTDGIAFRYTDRPTGANGYGSYRDGYRIITFDLNDIIIDENKTSKFSVDVGNFRVSSYRVGSYKNISVNIQTDQCFVVTGYSYGANPYEPFSYSLSSVDCGPCTVRIIGGTDSYSGDLNYTAAKSNAYYTSFAKGDYIDIVTDSSVSAYPVDGVQDGYYYVYIGEINLNIKSISVSGTLKFNERIKIILNINNTELPSDLSVTAYFEASFNEDGQWIDIGTSTLKITSYNSIHLYYRLPDDKNSVTFRAYLTADGFNQSNIKESSVYQITLNSPPATPSSISVPSSVQAGKVFTVSWGTSTDSDGNLSGYTLQRSLNGGSYTTIYTGSSRSYQDTIPKANYKTVTYRVQAYDTEGATSSYRTSSTATVINNVAPVISGINSNLGTFNYNPPTISYVVTDENNDTVTVTIQLDSSTLESRTVTLGQTYTVSLDWWNINTGSHTVTITANDGQGGTATRTYTFTKNSVGLISFNRLHKKISDSTYQVTYIETDSDSIITNNGQNLTERLVDIASKLSITLNTTNTDMILHHRLHIKLTSEYTIDYLEMYSTNVKVGTRSLEEVLVQLETAVGISNGGIVPSDLNFERWRMKSSSGTYDIIYLEGITQHVIRPCGKTVEESLIAIELKL